VQVRPSVQQGCDFIADLSLKETDSDIPENFRKSQSGQSEVYLSFPISGREVALLTGLVGRELELAGHQPEHVTKLLELYRENQELKEQLEELLFQLQEAQVRFLENRDRRRLPYSSTG
jgi:hypothetical protein